MRALITGATGFIGSHLADFLHDKGYEVSCIYRKTSNLRWLAGKPFNLIEASLSDTKSLYKAVEGQDYIFHSAGLTAARNYDSFLRANRDGTNNLLQATKEVNPDIKRFLFVSSQTAAGPSQTLESPLAEHNRCMPLTSYGKSKREAESAVLSCSADIPVTIIRPPAVFGPRDTATLQIFQTVNKGFGTLIGFRPKYISIIFSEDLVRAIAEAAESVNTIGKTYFVGSDRFYSWEELMNSMKDALGKQKLIMLKLPHFAVLAAGGLSGMIGKFSKNPPIFNYEKGIDFIQNYWTCSIENAKRDFGFKPQYSIDQAFKITADWYKENNWL